MSLDERRINVLEQLQGYARLLEGKADSSREAAVHFLRRYFETNRYTIDFLLRCAEVLSEASEEDYRKKIYDLMHSPVVSDRCAPTATIPCTPHEKLRSVSLKPDCSNINAVRLHFLHEIRASIKQLSKPTTQKEKSPPLVQKRKRPKKPQR